MPFFPIPDPDVGSEPEYIDEYLNFQNEIGLTEIEHAAGEGNEVVQRVKSYLKQAFSEPGEHNISERLKRAFLLASDARAGNSTDENIRNAERYLYSLSVAVDRDLGNLTVIAGAPLYEALKTLAHALKEADMPVFEYAMRSDENPTSKPSLSALVWTSRGLKSAISVDGDRKIEVKQHKSLHRSKSSNLGVRDASDLQFHKP